MGALKVKDPTAGGWRYVGVGPPGHPGPAGPAGPPGPTSEEVWVGIDAPDPVAMPGVELWFDPDDQSTLPSAAYPAGGTTEQALVKLSDQENDVGWGGPYLTQVDTDALYLTQAQADVLYMTKAQTDALYLTQALADPLYLSQAEADLLYYPVAPDYTWEEWNAEANLAANWSSDVTIGPCKVWRNRYSVVINMCLRRAAGTFAEDTWMDVITAGTLPLGWRPQYDLWDTRMSVEGLGSGSLFEIRVTNTGSIQVKMKGLTLDWQDQTRTAVYFSYMRAP